MKKIFAYTLILTVFFVLTKPTTAFTLQKPKLSLEQAAKEGNIDALQRLQSIPLDNALVMGDVNSSKKVIVFTDPDCSYCGKLHKEINKILLMRTDIVFFIKLYPLQTHKDAYWKSKSIICNKSIKLLEDAFNGGEIPKTDCRTDEIDSNISLAKTLGITGVPTLIYPDGQMKSGFMNTDKIIANIEGSVRNLSSTKIAVQHHDVQLKSDVDEPLAVKADPRPDDLAVIIGIENYQGLPKSDYSKSDAGLMKDYLKALGFQERNIEFMIDEKATKSKIETAIEGWLPNKVRKDSRVIVYYSGHGAPDHSKGEAYIVPYDGDPNYLTTSGYSLKRLYDNLGKLQVAEVIVLLDSCFSGTGGRSVLAKGARRCQRVWTET